MAKSPLPVGINIPDLPQLGPTTDRALAEGYAVQRVAELGAAVSFQIEIGIIVYFYEGEYYLSEPIIGRGPIMGDPSGSLDWQPDRKWIIEGGGKLVTEVHSHTWKAATRSVLSYSPGLT